MTAFDIYSAVGGVGEDILEESELLPKKKFTGVIPLIAAVAACLALFVFALSQNIVSPPAIDIEVTDTSVITTEKAVAETYSEVNLDGTAADDEAAVTNVQTSPPKLEVTGDGVVIYDPSAKTTSVSLFQTEIETTEMFTETYPATNTPEDEEAEEEEEAECEEEAESVGVPKWKELSDIEKYVYLEYNGNEYHITLKHFNGNELTFLQNGRLYGIDETPAEDALAVKRYSDPCVFYKIKNISPDYMIAVLTADGKYRGFENTSYYAGTLAEHIAETDFLKYANEGKFVSISDDTERIITNYTIEDLPAAVRKLLSAAPDAYPIAGMPYDPSNVPKCYLLERSNGITFMHVYDDGSIYICDRYYFIVGKENTDEFIRYVKENASDIEVVPYDIGSENDPVIPE